MATACAGLFPAQDKHPRCDPCVILHHHPVARKHHLFPLHKGAYKHQKCHLNRCEHSSFHGEIYGGLCVHSRRYHPKHRHSWSVWISFTDVWWMKTSSRSFPNENTSTIALEAKPESICKNNRPPLVARTVNILLCSLQPFLQMAWRERDANSWTSRIKIAFVKPSKHG